MLRKWRRLSFQTNTYYYFTCPVGFFDFECNNLLTIFLFIGHNFIMHYTALSGEFCGSKFSVFYVQLDVACDSEPDSPTYLNQVCCLLKNSLF